MYLQRLAKESMLTSEHAKGGHADETTNC